MSAALDLDALASITDIAEHQADALISQADSDTLSQVTRAAIAAVADPAKLRRFSRRGQQRLQEFARRLAKHSTVRQAQTINANLSGLGRSGSAFHVLYPRNKNATGKVNNAASRHLAGLGSWLSSAFHSITGVQLSNAIGPIAAAVTGNPAIGAAVSSISSATGRSNAATPFPTFFPTIAQPVPINGAVPNPFGLPNNSTAPAAGTLPGGVQSNSRPNAQPTRPANIPANWVPVLYGTAANGDWVWIWQPPTATAGTSSTALVPTGQQGPPSPWDIAAAQQSQQPAQQTAGIDSKYVLIGLAALAGIALLSRR